MSCRARPVASTYHAAFVEAVTVTDVDAFGNVPPEAGENVAPNRGCTVRFNVTASVTAGTPIVVAKVTIVSSDVPATSRSAAGEKVTERDTGERVSGVTAFSSPGAMDALLWVAEATTSVYAPVTVNFQSAFVENVTVAPPLVRSAACLPFASAAGEVIAREGG
jgi:hypothetical protein